MTSPIWELQDALVTRLLADAAVAGLVADRVYDAVPLQSDGTVAAATFPYVSLGPFDLVRDAADCIDGARITVQLDCWSRTPGFPQAHALSDAVVAAIEASDLTLTDNPVVLIGHTSTRVQREADGLTSHAIVILTAVVETA